MEDRRDIFGIEGEGGQKSPERAAQSHHRWLVVTILVLAISASFSAYHILRQIEYQMERNATAASDNRTWVFAQLEVDLLKLTAAISDAWLRGPQNERLDAARLQFDILYSRVSLIRNSDGYPESPLSRSPEWQTLHGPDGLIDRTLKLIDGPDAPLTAALPDLFAAYTAVQPGIRRAVVDTVNDVMGRGDAQRNNLRDTLRIVAIATLWLFFGVLTLMLGLYVQVRGRMRHARILERAVENLRNTINSALDAVLILDADGRIIGSNRATERIFGGVFDPQRYLLAHFLRDPANPDGRIRLRDLPTGQRTRLQCMRLDGVEFPAEASLATGSTSTGEPITVVFIRDISEQIAYEESLAEARNAALEADEAKARFLAVMSHEMRTPLNGLLSALDLLDRTTRLDDEQRWLAGIIRTCGQTTLEQVNNVLQLTRLASDEAGEHPATAFSLTTVVRDMAQQFCADALRNGTTLRVDCPEGPVGVVLPLQLLRRALGNLLSNAVKFTENGEITLRITVGPSIRPGHIAVRLAVEDTGIGFDPANLDRIFRNFETLDSSYVRVREGSGLGLGIAKLSVDAMGGRIEAHSEPGAGSCFAIHLDVPAAEIVDAPETRKPLPETPLAGLSVLIAEDNLINRTLLTRQVEGLGAAVTAVADGQDAVEAAQATQFDVILMDVAMPRKDGLAATREIRSGGRGAGVPVLAITAQASPDRLEQYRAAGVTEVLTKPVDVGDLVAEIRRHLPPAALPEGTAVPDAATADVPDAAWPDAALGDQGHIHSLIEDLGTGFLGSLLGSFSAEMEAALAKTRAALAQQDLAEVVRQAHTSAGAAAALGLTGLHLALRGQETAALADDAAAARAAQDRIEALFPRSVDHLRAALAAGAGASGN